MYELGKTIWADDHPELYGEALDFEALANVKSNELLLYDDDATEPFGGVVCTLAEYTEHGVLLDTGGEKLTAVDRDELEEEAGIWRLKTDGLPETDGIEALGLDEKTLNRLHKNCPEINTISKLIGTMYLPNAFEKISTPDMKRIESALKKNGIIKYMRGDWVDESDIDPEPLTWDELHDYVGKLLVHDCSTESQRCLKLVWIYKIEDGGDTCLSYLDGGTSFSNTRKGYINSDKIPITPNLAHEGQFFVLKNQRLRTAENAEEMPMKETEMKPDENASGTVPMLTEKQQAEALHKQIKSYGSIIMQSFYGLCVALKEMRDRGLYKTLGYSEFDYYCKTELGTSDRQVYKYIAIAENLSEEFVNSNSLIGVSKLYLLTTTDEETRTEIVRQNDLTETTVKELREQIAALKEESALDRKERDNANEAAQRWKNTAQSAQADNQRLEDQVQSLTDQVRELESRPTDVAVMDNDEELEKLAEEIDALREENAKLQAKSAESAAAGGRKDVYTVLRNIVNDGLSRIDDYLRQSGDIDCRRDAAEMLRKYLERWKG